MVEHKKSLKFRVTFTGTYEADPIHYGTNDVLKMCAIAMDFIRVKR